jgi:hypothetical protein
MTDSDELRAREAIKQSKARYFRGVDTSDGALVRSILAADCVLDYTGCCTDPTTGEDFLPQMNIVLNGRSSWSDGGFAQQGIVSVHQGFNFDIGFVSDVEARSICAMCDRMYFPAGSPLTQLTGFGYYQETYRRDGDVWRIATLRIERLKVSAERAAA